MSETEYHVNITREMDVARAIIQARKCAAACGFDTTRQTLISTSVSELARNILKYASRGEIVIRTLEERDRHGLEIVARDRGPGIEDVDAATQDHVSTGGTLGLGLPGVKRMMDEFELVSKVKHGTTVTVRKWL